MADTTTTTYNLTKIEVGASEDTWGGKINDNMDSIDDLLDGTTAIAPNLTAGSWQVGGVAVTSTAAELNLLDGVTYTLTDLNSLTATVTELNYTDGVTSNIQTQLDGKQAIDATLTAYAGTLTAANKIPYATALDTAGELDFVDEDDMASDSATAIPSQQSVKAYVDAEVGAIPDGVGVSQTWQDMGASRTPGTTYQNTTGKPIMVCVQMSSTSGRKFQVSSDGSAWVDIARSSSASFIEASAVIPNNHYYRIDGSISVNEWAELR